MVRSSRKTPPIPRRWAVGIGARVRERRRKDTAPRRYRVAPPEVHRPAVNAVGGLAPVAGVLAHGAHAHGHVAVAVHAHVNVETPGPLD